MELGSTIFNRTWLVQGVGRATDVDPSNIKWRPSNASSVGYGLVSLPGRGYRCWAREVGTVKSGAVIHGRIY